MIGYRSGRTFDAMMQAAGSTTKLIMREKQCKLLGNIKKSGIGTDDVEHAVRKLPLSDSAKQKLRIKIMTAKINSLSIKRLPQLSACTQILVEVK
jgi:hypothetical protein